MSGYHFIWREPDAETEDYPGFVVHDDRVSGSITAGYSRLPLWAVIGELFANGWAGIVTNWPEPYATKDQYADFFYYLLEQRGEFARLLCVLADVERRDGKRLESKDSDPFNDPAWWQRPEDCERVRAALKRCLDALEDKPPAATQGKEKGRK